jgi:hypothetical protein
LEQVAGQLLQEKNVFQRELVQLFRCQIATRRFDGHVLNHRTALAEQAWSMPVTVEYNDSTVRRA